MNILARLFWLPFNDRVVDRCLSASLAKTLGSYLRARGLWRIQLSDELLDDLLLEAHQRAGSLEADGKPRYRVMWQKMEEIADAAACAYKGHGDLDWAVVAILSKHGVANQSSKK